MGLHSPLDRNGPARVKSPTNAVLVWDSWREHRLRREHRLWREHRLGWKSRHGGEPRHRWEAVLRREDGHRVLEGNGGDINFSRHCDGVHLVKWDAMSKIHKMGAIDIDLEAIPGHSDDQGEGGTSR